MGSASSAPRKQVFDGCQMCKIGAKIQWQCLDCNLFLCDRCKYKDHHEFGAKHNIIENKPSNTIQSQEPINNLSGLTQQAQAPIGCQMCKKGARIQWRCEDCNLSICDWCKYSDHQKFGAHHNIININDKSKDGNHDNKLRNSEKKSPETNINYDDKHQNIKFKMVKQYTVDTRYIHNMVVSADGSLWIGDGPSEKLLHIKLSSDSVTVLSSFNIHPLSLAILPSGSPLVIQNHEMAVKIINEKTGQLKNTKFTAQPWILTCVHVTRAKNIILGGAKGYKGCVIVMDQNGEELKRYKNKEDKSMFTNPRCIATTRNGNIFIADGRPENSKGRVVRIRPKDRDIVFYEGHSYINSDDKPFHPVSILVTPRDNVLIIDLNTDYLHILNTAGDFISYYNIKGIGVIKPNSMALSVSGNIYADSKGSPPDYKDTLYELEFSGI